MQQQIRTRFAPSPTGDMHIGNLRTAIFNWLFARQNNGLFFLRIEDTDESRSNIVYEQRIFEILKWMKLDFDLFNDRVIKQSERNEIYSHFAKKIPNAYYCQCIESSACRCYENNYSSGVLRFRVEKDRELTFQDIVFGRLNTNSNQIENFALIRSDGTATYNLAVVIDDYLMGISHIIRGEDHKTNTFKQIMLYESMGLVVPQFAHLPIIKGKDGKKLSKREKSSSAQELYEEGVCSEAIFNILIKLGWSYGDKELINRSEALSLFNIKNVKRSSATFETKKLYSFSRKYIPTAKEEAFIFLQTFFGKINEEIFNYFYEELALKCMTFRDIVKIAPFILEKNTSYVTPQKLREISLEKLMSKSIEEQKSLRFEITGSENGLSLINLWKFYNSTS